MAVQDALDRVRNPQYTGENRCIPCTGVNIVLAVGLALAVQAAVLVADGPPIGAALAGALVFASGMAAIVLRGYLVPGTPRITKTYLPDWVLAKFDKGPAEDSSVRSPPGDGVEDDDEFTDEAAEATLSRLGAVTECEDVDDLCLTDDFRSDWHDRAVALRPIDGNSAADGDGQADGNSAADGDGQADGDPAADLHDDLAAMIDVAPDALSVTDHGGAWSASVDGRRVGQWESRGAVLADVAAANALRERNPGTWADLSVTQRGQLLKGLRVFVEQCPTCDGVAAVEEETVESCCRSVDVVAVVCRDCGQRLFEAEKPGG